MAHVVLDLNDQRPIWSQPDWFAREIREALPSDWTLEVLDTPSEGTGDGATRAHPRVLEAVADARVYMGFGIAEEVLRGAPELGWVHTGSAGVGSSLTPPLLERDILFTNSAGIHGPPMAEAVLGMILHFFRGFDFAQVNKAAGRWDPDPFYAADAPLMELSEATVGIVGYGGIGRELGWRLQALGARVLGLTRRPRPAAPELLHGEEGFHRLLAESDVVCVTAPDTPETRGMMDAGAFSRMKPGSLFVNVARGAVADEAALLGALRSGRLRGAALDVFHREPLPAGHPFWDLPNVLVTPHVSPVTRAFWRREADLILHNLGCFLTGEAHEMRNLVDKAAGY